MEIKQVNDNDSKKGHFKATEGGLQAGLMTYVYAGPQKIIIDHTEVDPDFEGQGVGKNMVMAAVEFARENNIKILPLCPFAKSVFNRSPDIADVLV